MNLGTHNAFMGRRLKCSPGFLISGRTSTYYTAATRRILKPRLIFYADCLNQQSILFLAIVVHPVKCLRTYLYALHICVVE